MMRKGISIKKVIEPPVVDIKVNVDELTIANHLTTVEWVKTELQKPIDKLFKAKPELKNSLYLSARKKGCSSRNFFFD
jgi:hypothetical protein